jgi:hypothetical protein
MVSPTALDPRWGGFSWGDCWRLAAGHEYQRPARDHPQLDLGVRLGVVLRCCVGVMFGMRSMTSGSVSMMRGGFMVIILMMLCSFGVMLGRVFVVLGGLLVVRCSLMILHFNLHFFESLVDRQRRLVMELSEWTAIPQQGQFGELVMTAGRPNPDRSRLDDSRLSVCETGPAGGGARRLRAGATTDDRRALSADAGGAAS